MSPAEYLELIIMSRDSIAAGAMNAIAIFTAYVVAMYIAAKQLSVLQHLILSIAYTIFYFAPVRTVVVTISQVFALGAGFFEDHPDEAIRFVETGTPSEGTFIFPLLFMFIAAWLGSLVFAYTLRKEKV